MSVRAVGDGSFGKLQNGVKWDTARPKNTVYSYISIFSVQVMPIYEGAGSSGTNTIREYLGVGNPLRVIEAESALPLSYVMVTRGNTIS